jgi:hypothetical protein
MKAKDQIRPGDAVEIELVRSPPPLLSYVPTAEEVAAAGPTPIWEWVSATVVHADREQIAVAFSDGERFALPRHSRHWRPA